MMDVDARLRCGACPFGRLRSGNGTRDMNEPTVTWAGGSEVARSGWSPAADRADAPRPEAVRAEAAQAVRPLPGAPRPPDAAAEAESDPGTKEPSKEPAHDAAFPTS